MATWLYGTGWPTSSRSVPRTTTPIGPATLRSARPSTRVAARTRTRAASALAGKKKPALAPARATATKGLSEFRRCIVKQKYLDRKGACYPERCDDPADASNRRLWCFLRRVFRSLVGVGGREGRLSARPAQECHRFPRSHPGRARARSVRRPVGGRAALRRARRREQLGAKRVGGRPRQAEELSRAALPARPLLDRSERLRSIGHRALPGSLARSFDVAVQASASRSERHLLRGDRSGRRQDGARRQDRGA